MTLDGTYGVVAAITIIVALLGQIAGLIYIARLTREGLRIGRAVAAMVYQEEEKTRAYIRQTFGPGPASG